MSVMADIYIHLHPGTLKHTSVTYSINSYNSRRKPMRVTGTKRMTMFGLTAGCRMFPGSALKLQHKLHSARAIVKYSVSNSIIITTNQLKMQRQNSRAFSKNSHFPQTGLIWSTPLAVHFFPASVARSAASGTAGASAGLFNAPSLRRCFGVFVWIILLILPILTAVQVLQPCAGRVFFSRNPRFRADKTMCGAL